VTDYFAIATDITRKHFQIEPEDADLAEIRRKEALDRAYEEGIRTFWRREGAAVAGEGAR
jgi:hypothetical protein